VERAEELAKELAKERAKELANAAVVRPARVQRPPRRLAERGCARRRSTPVVMQTS
jgi:hypothetical protein